MGGGGVKEVGKGLGCRWGRRGGGGGLVDELVQYLLCVLCATLMKRVQLSCPVPKVMLSISVRL